jgi:sulfate transport system substrate-binding protein
MYTKTVENIRKALPEFLLGLGFILVGVLLLWSATLAFAASPNAGRALPAARLALVGTNADRGALSALATAFRQTTAGRNVSFTSSFSSSARQSTALAGGRAADVVSLPSASDVDALVGAKVVGPGWAQNRYHGIVADSVVVFVVRKGNPDGIHTWRDIAQPNIEVVFANPYYSDAGKWNVLAAYGAQRELGRSQPVALEYLRSLFRNVGVQDPTDAQSLHTFLSGEGDVLLTTESQALQAKRAGAKIDDVVPNQTLLVETPVAVTAKAAHPEQARAFVHWLWTPEAQALLVRHGLRPVLPSAAQKGVFPRPAGLFTINKIGGWSWAQTRFFDQSTGWVTKIEQDLGVATGSAG